MSAISPEKMDLQERLLAKHTFVRLKFLGRGAPSGSGKEVPPRYAVRDVQVGSLEEVAAHVEAWLGGAGSWQLMTAANGPLTSEAIRRPTTKRCPLVVNVHDTQETLLLWLELLDAKLKDLEARLGTEGRERTKEAEHLTKRCDQMQESLQRYGRINELDNKVQSTQYKARSASQLCCRRCRGGLDLSIMRTLWKHVNYCSPIIFTVLLLFGILSWMMYISHEVVSQGSSLMESVTENTRDVAKLQDNQEVYENTLKDLSGQLSKDIQGVKSDLQTLNNTLRDKLDDVHDTEGKVKQEADDAAGQVDRMQQDLAHMQQEDDDKRAKLEKHLEDQKDKLEDINSTLTAQQAAMLREFNKSITKQQAARAHVDRSALEKAMGDAQAAVDAASAAKADARDAAETASQALALQRLMNRTLNKTEALVKRLSRRSGLQERRVNETISELHALKRKAEGSWEELQAINQSGLEKAEELRSNLKALERKVDLLQEASIVANQTATIQGEAVRKRLRQLRNRTETIKAHVDKEAGRFRAEALQLVRNRTAHLEARVGKEAVVAKNASILARRQEERLEHLNRTFQAEASDQLDLLRRWKEEVGDQLTATHRETQAAAEEASRGVRCAVCTSCGGGYPVAIHRRASNDTSLCGDGKDCFGEQCAADSGRSGRRLEAADDEAATEEYVCCRLGSPQDEPEAGPSGLASDPDVDAGSDASAAPAPPDGPG